MLSRIFLIKRGECCGLKCHMCPFEDRHSGSSKIIRQDVLKDLNDFEIEELESITDK